MNKITQFRDKCRESKYVTLIIFCFLAINLFLQCVISHCQIFNSILISSIISQPVVALSFYAPKLIISLSLASFVFLFKDKRWSVIISIIVNVWIYAELMYFRANHLTLDSYTMTMVSNMEGFWSSLLLLINPIDVIYFILSLVFLALTCIFNNNKFEWKTFLVVFVVCLMSNTIDCFVKRKKIDNEHSKMLIELIGESGDEIFPPGANGQRVDLFLHPFSFDMVGQLYGTIDKYLYDYSIIHALLYKLKELISMKSDKTELDNINLDLLNHGSINVSHDGKLLICLIESLENWVITPDYTPNLFKLSKMSNILYCNKITSQARRGTSADGQMIAVTGMLPIRGGAVCFRYPHSRFPSVFEIYKKEPNCAFFPHNLTVWNQEEMSKAYMIDTNYVVPEYDNVLFRTVCDSARYYSSMLFITSSTHSPFTKQSDSSRLSVLDDMPKFMKAYIKSCNYMDESVKILIDHIENDPVFSDYTIVITGDHTIFQDEKRDEFVQYCKEKKLELSVEEAYCPLIVYSPKINGNINITDIAYQMDIYPTILHLIGCEDYYWKGFGVNLLDSVARKNRPITEDEAFELSDKIIRADYFRTYLDSLHNY